MKILLLLMIVLLISCKTGPKRGINDNLKTNSNVENKAIEIDKSTLKKEFESHDFNKGIIPYNKIDYSIYKIKYHKWRSTASTPILTKWNLKENEVNDYFLQETINENNQVIELKFMKSKNEIYSDFTIDESPIIRFVYSQNKVIVTYYDSSKNPNYAFEAGLPTQITYYLNDNNNIDKTECEVYVSPNMSEYFDLTTVISGIKEIKEGCNPKMIFDYLYSDSKFNGIIPIKEGFDISSIKKPYDIEN